MKQVVGHAEGEDKQKVLILRLLIERIKEFPTLSLETYRRMLVQYFQSGFDDHNIGLRMEIINLGMAIYG